MADEHVITYEQTGTCSHGCHTYFDLVCSCGWSARADLRHDGKDAQRIMGHQIDVLAQRVGVTFTLPES